jgi:NAD-dependent dihydropyrimidine dehydrogenase PreA subunit
VAHVIVDTCVKDNICVNACPGDAIHPLKDEAEATTVSQLYINPDECLDCGACVSVCPTNSIYPAEELPADEAQFVKINADYFRK